MEMIEQVSPDDVAKLDKIDARLWCFVNEQQMNQFGRYTDVNFPEIISAIYRSKSHLCHQYTRARDSLSKLGQKLLFEVDNALKQKFYCRTFTDNAPVETIGYERV